MNMAAAAVNDLSVLDAALLLASQGTPVFPCRADNKRPHTEHGFKDATRDPEQIRAWWRRWPNAMLAAPTGPLMGAWVLDIDDPGLFEGACEIALPSTRRSNTGKGYHLFFAWDDAAPIYNAQQSVKGWPFPNLPGAEVRGEGGYVILPPSLHPSGRSYLWLNDCEPSEAPDELLEIVSKASTPEIKAEVTPLFQQVVTEDHAYGLAALRAECAAIMAAGDGAQENQLNAASLKMGGLVGGGSLSFQTASGQLIAAGLCMRSTNPKDPWTPQVIAAKVERGLRDGMRTPRQVPEPQANAEPISGRIASQRTPAAPKSKPANDSAGELSEDMIAVAFTQQHGGNLLFDHHVGKWYHWTGVYWQMDETDLAFDYARLLARSLSDGKRVIGKAATASGVERLARADRTHAVTSSTWDSDPLLLGTPDGVINLGTGELSDPDRDDRITKQTGTAPAHGTPELWLRFLEQSLDGDQELIKFLQLWSGYCLTGLTTAHALLFIFGPGGNGKSVFLNTLINILGTYGAVAAMETFTASKSERHSTELAMLRGARLVTASETEEGRAWAEAKIKAMTGGDPITARFMRQDNFTFRPQFKLTIAGNHAPSLRSVDDAMRRRFNIAPFILKPANPDRFLEEKLRAEYPQILAWAIAGAREYLSSGLTRPAAVIAATNEYFSEQDVFGQWFQERCEERQGSWDLCAKFYADWVAFSKSHGEEPGSLKMFGTNMGRKGYKSALRKDLGVQGKIYSGVKLIVQQEAETDDWR
jgi:P4 family phage/plasmid primase-like protien